MESKETRICPKKDPSWQGRNISQKKRKKDPYKHTFDSHDQIPASKLTLDGLPTLEKKYGSNIMYPGVPGQDRIEIGAQRDACVMDVHCGFISPSAWVVLITGSCGAESLRGRGTSSLDFARRACYSQAFAAQKSEGSMILYSFVKSSFSITEILSTLVHKMVKKAPCLSNNTHTRTHIPS